MATVSHRNSKGMYSWWWNSHISPKNSKWLQENLTGMDSKVNQMIKLIEEDADSFARRAEMYYKKRPELMKLVEEFYRAYRGLAERYDHATGVIRQAHRAMAEAFPNQVPMVLGDDAPTGSVTGESDPNTPTHMRGAFDPDELQSDGHSSSNFHAVKRNGVFTEESDTPTRRKGLKQLNDLFGSGEGKARKSLNFQDAEENDRGGENNGNPNAEIEILTLKKNLAQLEADKESCQLQYQQSLESLSKLESEISRAKEDSQRINERASKAESEVQTLNEAVAEYQADKEATLVQYKQCVEKISNMESNISDLQNNVGELVEQASKSEVEYDMLKQELTRVEAEKEAASIKYKQQLEKISDLEDKLLHAMEDARKIDERALKAETEVEILKAALIKMTEEKEAIALQYQQCLKTISVLEHKLAFAEEEAQRFKYDIENGIAKLQYAEERCLTLERSNQTMHTELESIMHKVEFQNLELSEKNKESGRLWSCMQEERLRYVEAETAFQTLQQLHSQSQEELRSLDTELQNKAQLLKDMEIRQQNLVDEVHKVSDENKGLNALNLSSAISIKNLQDEILSLRETVKKLEEEVGLRVDQRNALQQEIYCLKEELNVLKFKHIAMLEQVNGVGLDPELLGSSVKELQDDNSKLKDICERDRIERVALLEKLENMEKLTETKSILEKSLSDLHIELEGVRVKVTTIEESCQSLLGEKSSLLEEKAALILELQITADNMEKLLQKSNLLENSLSDANSELEELRMKSNCLEDSYQLLNNEKAALLIEREHLSCCLETTQQRLENVEKMYKELEEKHLELEKEKEFRLGEIEELRGSLDARTQEHASFSQLSEIRMAGMESEIRLLKEEGLFRKTEYEDQLDKAISAQIEFFIWKKCLQDSEKKNFSLLLECQTLLEASKISDKMISEMEHENLVKQAEVKSMCDQIEMLRMGLLQVLKTLGIDVDHEIEDKIGEDLIFLNHILRKLEEMQETINKTHDENHQMIVEKSVLFSLLGKLRVEAANLETEKESLQKEFGSKSEQFSVLEGEMQNLKQVNEELNLQLKVGHGKEEVLTTELENLIGKVSSLHLAYKKLLEENFEVCEAKISLTKEVTSLTEEKYSLEQENSVLIGEIISLDNLSIVLKDVVSQKFVELKELNGNLDVLHGIKKELDQKLQKMEENLEIVQAENSHLKESVEKSENELKLVRSVGDKLTCEIATGQDLLSRRDNELLQAEQKISAIQNEKTELCKFFNLLRREYDEAKMTIEDQVKKILQLAADNDYQNEENQCQVEANKIIEAELCKLNLLHEESKNREESLRYDLQKGRDEVELWGSQAETLFGEVQMYDVCSSLYVEKIHELTEAYKGLEDRTTSKGLEIDHLKGRVGALEGENDMLKSKLAAYVPAVNSLTECISSLEKHTDFRRVDDAESKDARLLSNFNTESLSQTDEAQSVVVPVEISNLQDLQGRIKTVEMVVMEMERLTAEDNSKVRAKLEAAMRQIEELKAGSSSHQRTRKSSSHVSLKGVGEEPGSEIRNDLNLQKLTPIRISRSGSEVTKDIMLDHISQCSSYGLSRRGNADQMLELWETADQDGSIDLTVGKGQKAGTVPSYDQIEEIKENKYDYPSIESLVEKELSVDKLEISKRSTEPNNKEGNKRKILERLDSDAQKLTNLQITVQDLKKKVEITDSQKGEGIEYDSVKGQLEEADKAIMKSFDVNRKLVKSIEDGSVSPGIKSPQEANVSGSVRKRRVSEQARRVSEKIGRLQMEVQKIQFLLLKLDDEKQNHRGRTQITERNSRVLLRDYIYAGTRNKQRRKRDGFCACVRPPTRE